MSTLNKITDIGRTAAELALLVAIIAVGGFVLPIHIAPYLANLFSITTPYEAQRQIMSVNITNRNASHGESILLGISDPASSVRIQSLSYSCDTGNVRLGYSQNDGLQEIPCGTDLLLPSSTQHRITPLTSSDRIILLPVSIVLANGDVSGELSVVIATAASNADEKSPLEDDSTATLRSFFRE